MTQRSTAIADATTIKNEVAAGANTATRVGNNLLEIATNAAFTEDVGTSIAPLTSGFAQSCNSLTRVFEDWIVQNAVPVTNGITQTGGLFCDAANNNAATFQPDTVTERGLLRYSVTTVNGFYGFIGGGGNNKSIKLQTSDGFYFSVRCSIATLSDGTDNALIFHGLTSGAEALGNDALVAQHDRATDATHWVFTYVAGGTPTNVVTTVTITPGQLYVLEMVKIAGSNTVTCYVDGVSVGTFTLASPTATMQLASYLKKTLGSGNARTTDVDWLEWQINQPNKRASSFLA